MSTGASGVEPTAVEAPIASEPITRDRLASEILPRLRREIVTGFLKPGEPVRLVPTAARLGVSTTPLREALAALERQGLLTAEPRRGYRVSTFDARDIEDVFAVHAFAIGRATAAAVRRFSDDELDDLVALDDDMLAALEAEDPVRAIEINDEIHRRIRERGTSHGLTMTLAETAPLVSVWSDQDAVTGAYYRAISHKSIIEAMRARDSDRAAKLMAEHIAIAGDAAAKRSRG